MNELPNYQPEAHHTELGTDFFDEVEAANFPKHILRYRNQRWAARVGLDSLNEASWVGHFGAFQALPQNLARPLSLRYHGHQFRSYNPELGDGRGFLFAQMRDHVDARLLDLGTKGSGTTPWSRGGDGRLTLKGGVREVLATAMLEALGVYTSKSFSLIETGEALTRGDEPSPTRSSVLVRLGHSHVRFGSFQRQAALQRSDNIKRLLDYSIHYYLAEASALSGLKRDSHFDPERERSDAEWQERCLAFLQTVLERSADLAASWMVAGFVHGVLNTDNLNITGESFDYGPYRFLPTLDPGFTAAYFDHGGLYAYGRQPETVVWNLTRLAETLLPLVPEDALVPVLDGFEASFHAAYLGRMLARLGVSPKARDGAGKQQAMELVNAITNFLHECEIGFEQLFFDWYGGQASSSRAAASPERQHYQHPTFDAVKVALANHAPLRDATLLPSYFDADRPCTLLIDEIESIWQGIDEHDDWSAFERKLDDIEAMRNALAWS